MNQPKKNVFLYCFVWVVIFQSVGYHMGYYGGRSAEVGECGLAPTQLNLLAPTQNSLANDLGIFLLVCARARVCVSVCVSCVCVRARMRRRSCAHAAASGLPPIQPLSPSQQQETTGELRSAPMTGWPSRKTNAPDKQRPQEKQYSS